MIFMLVFVSLAWPASLQFVHSTMQHPLWIPAPNGKRTQISKTYLSGSLDKNDFDSHPVCHCQDVALLEKLIKEDIDAGKLPLLLIANAGKGHTQYKHCTLYVYVVKE